MRHKYLSTVVVAGQAVQREQFITLVAASPAEAAIKHLQKIFRVTPPTAPGSIKIGVVPKTMLKHATGIPIALHVFDLVYTPPQTGAQHG